MQKGARKEWKERVNERERENRVARQFACMCFSLVPMREERGRRDRGEPTERGKEEEEGKGTREKERDGSERPQNICCMLVDARLQRGGGGTEIIAGTPATDRTKRKKEENVKRFAEEAGQW